MTRGVARCMPDGDAAQRNRMYIGRKRRKSRGAGRSEANSRRLERRSQVDNCRKNSIIVTMELGLKRNEEAAGVATGACVLVAPLSLLLSSSSSSWSGFAGRFLAWGEDSKEGARVVHCSALRCAALRCTALHCTIAPRGKRQELASCRCQSYFAR